MKLRKRHPRTYKNPYRKMYIITIDTRCGPAKIVRWVYTKEDDKRYSR
jgi:hypothetical protein